MAGADKRLQSSDLRLPAAAAGAWQLSSRVAQAAGFAERIALRGQPLVVGTFGSQLGARHTGMGASGMLALSLAERFSGGSREVSGEALPLAQRRAASAAPARRGPSWPASSLPTGTASWRAVEPEPASEPEPPGPLLGELSALGWGRRGPQSTPPALARTPAPPPAPRRAAPASAVPEMERPLASLAPDAAAEPAQPVDAPPIDRPAPLLRRAAPAAAPAAPAARAPLAAPAQRAAEAPAANPSDALPDAAASTAQDSASGVELVAPTGPSPASAAAAPPPAPSGPVSRSPAGPSMPPQAGPARPAPDLPLALPIWRAVADQHMASGALAPLTTAATRAMVLMRTLAPAALERMGIVPASARAAMPGPAPAGDLPLAAASPGGSPPAARVSSASLPGGGVARATAGDAPLAGSLPAVTAPTTSQHAASGPTIGSDVAPATPGVARSADIAAAPATTGRDKLPTGPAAVATTGTPAEPTGGELPGAPVEPVAHAAGDQPAAFSSPPPVPERVAGEQPGAFSPLPLVAGPVARIPARDQGRPGAPPVPVPVPADVSRQATPAPGEAPPGTSRADTPGAAGPADLPLAIPPGPVVRRAPAEARPVVVRRTIATADFAAGIAGRMLPAGAPGNLALQRLAAPLATAALEGQAAGAFAGASAARASKPGGTPSILARQAAGLPVQRTPGQAWSAATRAAAPLAEPFAGRGWGAAGGDPGPPRAPAGLVSRVAVAGQPPGVAGTADSMLPGGAGVEAEGERWDDASSDSALTGSAGVDEAVLVGSERGRATAALELPAAPFARRPGGPGAGGVGGAAGIQRWPAAGPALELAVPPRSEVQREPDTPPVAPTRDQGGAEGQADGGMDLDDLVQKVYNRLRQRLLIEQERRGRMK